MKKTINAAVCDARNATEDSLAGFENITINAATLIVDGRAKELLNRYFVTIHAANVLEIPDGQNIFVKTINGKGEIGPDADGTGIFLMVNGKLTIADGSKEAVKSYYRIVVNGKVLMPLSFKGQFANMQINGSAEYYPDGAVILKADTEIDKLFIARAAKPLYYCSGNLYFLDGKMDAEKMIAKGLRFAAKKVVIAESLIDRLISLFDEETAIVCVPDGTRLIDDDDLELKPGTIRKYGTKLCVSGDISIQDAEALASVEYLFADGTVRVNRNLEEAFEAVRCDCGEIKIIDTDRGYISDRPAFKVGAASLAKYPGGVWIEDCAKVTLCETLRPEDIMEKLHISDCALVICTREQEEAVSLIAEDVAMIRTSAQEEDEEDLDRRKDVQVINAAEYML